MCLSYSDPVDKLEGYFYKVVREIRDGVFTSEYQTFRDGAGIWGLWAKGGLKGATYRLGVPYRVRHNRTSRSHHDKKDYRAGVHGYKSYQTAKSHLRLWRFDSKFRVVKFHWFMPVAQDDKVLVALEVTPVKVMS